MAAPRPRHDRYGRPLPTLVEASTDRPPRSKLHSETNIERRQHLLWLLEHTYADLFQEGVWADMVLKLTINDGTLQKASRILVDRAHDQDQRRE